MVTGGAGYIGAHAALLLAERGEYVLVVDDLVAGSSARVPDLPILQLDLAADDSRDRLAAAMTEHSIDAVIHFAAQKQVVESVERPAWYYRQNVGGLAQLLLAMEDASVTRLIFSSSAAVYGHADGAVDEDCETAPLSPYGETKLAGEKLIAAAARATPLRAASLRYFNVGGAGRPELGDTEAVNLIPIVFEGLATGEQPLVFGGDYKTPDGTCIRDYVHVLDVAEAHLAVLDALPEAPGHVAMNIGTGIGTSVLEIVDAIIAVTGSALRPVIVGRRAGDPASVVAVVDRIAELSGWAARFTLDDIVQSAWDSRQRLIRTAG